MESPDLSLFEAGLVDLQSELSRLETTTPIFLGLQELIAANHASPQSAACLAYGVAGLLERILGDPSAEKYYKFNLTKFFRKVGPIVNGYPFLTLFGIQIDFQIDCGILPSPEASNHDLSLLRCRCADLKRSLAQFQVPVPGTVS